MGIKKSKAGVEDLTFGMETETQLRIDDLETITQINSEKIPHTESVSVGAKLEENKSQVDAVNADLNTHIADNLNPHNVTIGQIGAAPSIHQHPISDVAGLQSALDSKANNAEVFKKTEHVQQSSGALDAGKPIVLDNTGNIDATMLGEGVYPVGMWDPSGGQEYPDTTGYTPGASWTVYGLTGPYTFLAGDLAGITCNDGDQMIYGSDSWIYKAGLSDAAAYYRNDGTIAISAPFAGGGQQFKNAAGATENGDLVTYEQVVGVIDGSVLVDGSNPMEADFDAGGFKLTNVAAGAAADEAVIVGQMAGYLANIVYETDATGAVIVTKGSTLQRPGTPENGHFRYNLDTDEFEGYSAGEWGAIGGGGAINDNFYENSNTLTESYTIVATRNAMTASPFEIPDGMTVTVEDNANWILV